MQMPKELRRCLNILACVAALAHARAFAAEPDSASVRSTVLTVSVGGGLHSLNPSSSSEAVSTDGLRPGFSLSLACEWPLAPSWRFGTGVGISSFASRTETNEVVVTTDAVDLDGESFVHTLSLRGVSEGQDALFVRIPLAATYHAPVTHRLSFEAGLRVFASFLARDSYKTRGGLIATTGYYPKYNLTFDSDMPENGFYSVRPDYHGGSGLRKIGCGAGASVGLCRHLTPALGLCFGLYAECSLTDFKPSGAAAQYDPDCRRRDGYTPVYHGALAYSASSLRPIAIGVSVGLRLSCGRKRGVAATPGPSLPAAVPAEPIVEPRQEDDVQKQLHVSRAPVARDSLARRIDADIQSMIDEAGGIRFDKGSGALVGESAEAVARIAHLLNAYPAYNVRIIGHTCDVGSHEVNIRIGMERAEAVARCLEYNGVDDGRIKVLSVGDSDPLYPNDTEEHRRMNRRVKIEVRKVE